MISILPELKRAGPGFHLNHFDRLTHSDYPDLSIPVDLNFDDDFFGSGYFKTKLSVCGRHVLIKAIDIISIFNKLRRIGVVPPIARLLQGPQKNKENEIVSCEVFCNQINLKSLAIDRRIKKLGQSLANPRISDQNFFEALKGVNKIESLLQEEVEIEKRIRKERRIEESQLTINLYRQVERCCNSNQFEWLLEENFPLFPFKTYLKWKRHLTWCLIKSTKVSRVLTYLYENVPIWKKACPQGGQIYIPSNKEVPYSFLYDHNGTIWMYFSYMPAMKEQIQALAINLRTGLTHQTIHYGDSDSKKIVQFSPLFENHPGLLHFVKFDRFENLDFPFSLAMHKLPSANLWEYAEKCSEEEKHNIAFQLIGGLLVLESAGIVHCGIYPTTILFRITRRKTIEAFLSNFELAYFTDELPNKVSVSSIWKECLPPECSNPTNEIEDPSAIPIYQLGICFRYLFGTQTTLKIKAMIDGMTDNNPKTRWRLRLVLDQLGLNLSPKS